MKASSLALVFATILSFASIAQAISVVLVTDDAGMHALADSDERGLIPGTVSSVESKQYGGGPSFIYILPASKMIMASEQLSIPRRGRTSMDATSPVLWARRSK
jgi:hypothetical protein